MGVAAFVLAALTGVGYSYVIVAAALPAARYFFLLVLFHCLSGPKTEYHRYR
ncbi:MAG: hypothetical protein AAGD04_06040 [Pseudomonadota bacterium]